MTEVRLTGQLVCSDAAEQSLVVKFLPEHIALTRAEPGCLHFEVTRIGDSRTWRVEERFTDASAFTAHQARVATSEWGRATQAITRDYTVEGLSPQQAN